MTVRVALVGGPMYDGLYEHFNRRDIEIVVHADHPSLNRAVSTMLRRGERIDVISTHSKYAPSQRGWLLDLRDVVSTDELASRAVELCTFEGSQYCVPRNIDVRVLWANRRLLGDAEVPTSWQQLAASRMSFAFPGKESGLFGTLLEIVTVLGGSLFDAGLRPQFDQDIVVAALQLLQSIANNAPAALPEWDYDDVDAALGDGSVVLGAAWPGGTATVRASPEGANLEPHPYFGDAVGPRSYAGCHAWAIPRSCGDIDGAVDFVRELCGYEMQALDALTGSVCAHRDAFAAVVPTDAVDVRRLAITQATITAGMLTYPPMDRFPEIEDAAWLAIRALLLADSDAKTAACAMQCAAMEVLQ